MYTAPGSHSGLPVSATLRIERINAMSVAVTVRVSDRGFSPNHGVELGQALLGLIGNGNRGLRDVDHRSRFLFEPEVSFAQKHQQTRIAFDGMTEDRRTNSDMALFGPLLEDGTTTPFKRRFSYAELSCDLVLGTTDGGQSF